MEGNKGWGNR